MSRYLIDTDWVVDVLRGQPAAITYALRVNLIIRIGFGRCSAGAVRSWLTTDQHA